MSRALNLRSLEILIDLYYSPIATRSGVYILHGWCSCLRPFSENVRFGVPVFFPLGVPVVSRWCPGGVMVSQWCRVVFQWCCGGVPAVSQWCLGSVMVPSRWCPSSCGVSVVSRCRSAGPVVSGARVVSQWYLGRVPVVPRWCCSISSVVPVVSRWLVSHSQWCRVLLCVSVVSQCCSSGVLAVFHPVVSRLCPVFHAAATTISENLRRWGGWCPVGEEVW